MSHNSGIHFEISERKILLRLFDLLFIGVSLYLVSTFFEFDYFRVYDKHWAWFLVLALYISVFGTVLELYDLQKSSRLDSVLGTVLTTTSVTVLFYLLTPFYTPSLPENRLQILYFYLAILFGLYLWRWAYITFISSPRFFKKVLLVGETSNIKSIVDAFANADPNYKIIGFINCEIDKKETIKYTGLQEYEPADLHQIIKAESISEVVIASYNSENITPAIYSDLIMLLEKGFPIKEYTQVYEDITYRVPVQFVGKDFYKYFPFSRNNKNKLYLTYRRLFDVLLASIGVLIGLLILPLVLLGNLIGNRGSLFYSQERVGQNGAPFQIFKFRTMIKNAETNKAVWATKNDSRITAFGKFLRVSRLDEMPQFINILKGDMSLIGPRPERPYFVEELSQVIPFYETRHIIKPGLTGWAQVKARYGSSVDDSLLKLQYDLYYIKHRSFLLDINIIVKTLSTVIFFRGQ
ncbi:exopolysaccharide biosynthesis polyprenyl glycosylphosphotransferase [Olleya sp. Bg11-27]|uniref:exopolysaccharide biosynthesis polyprenyl glycosylphosphotransferase n=1 Tax=Olleya sp. Bg11-27 TaxID=2058135 RepID=UPI000C319444|nr:exopolysaccharide biosynthesis polyprenyl glycosylphosphotransferase [Olleya sp. Bg11-27]AUC75836.1 sugar transferase [Olleya sp. Bg11-27]